MKLGWQALQPAGLEEVQQTKLNDIMVETMQWRGKSTSQPMDKGWKETWAELKKRKLTPKQCSAQRRNKTQRMKTQWLIHAIRVKQALEHAVEPDKPVSNGKCMNARTTMYSYRSGAHTQNSGTTYLYPANTGKVDHGSKVREGGLAVGRRGGLFWGFHSSFFGINVLLGWHPTQRRQTWAEITSCML